MRHGSQKLIVALAALGAALLLLWLAFSERLAPEDSGLTMAVGLTGLALLLGALYFVPASALAARGRARLLAGKDVVARWQVDAADWERYRAIEAASIHRSVFIPRRRPATAEVEIIAGKKSVLIDDCYFALSPARSAGMLSAQWARTSPACIEIVIGQISRTASTGNYRTKRAFLLLPVPSAAIAAGDQALRHYQRAVAGVRDLGDLARGSPVLAWRIFWSLLAISLAVAAVGLGLHVGGGQQGDLPAGLAMGGLMTALGIVIVGWFHLSRRQT